MKNYYILSIKKTQASDFAVFYRPNSYGYTVDINQAGKFTEEEALAVERTSHGGCKAISEDEIGKKKQYRTIIYPLVSKEAISL